MDPYFNYLPYQPPPMNLGNQPVNQVNQDHQQNQARGNLHLQFQGDEHGRRRIRLNLDVPIDEQQQQDHQIPYYQGYYGHAPYYHAPPESEQLRYLRGNVYGDPYENYNQPRYGHYYAPYPPYQPYPLYPPEGDQEVPLDMPYQPQDPLVPQEAPQAPVAPPQQRRAEPAVVPNDPAPPEVVVLDDSDDDDDIMIIEHRRLDAQEHANPDVLRDSESENESDVEGVITLD